MKIKNYKKNILLQIVFLLLCLIILGVVIIRLEVLEFPSITSDELAYLSQAARYAGIEGKNLMQYYAFYGQGVSLLWSPLFHFFSNNPVQIYKAIILLNALMLIISFGLSYKCSIFLFPKWNNWVRIFSCFLIIVYPCNFYYMQIASTENVLYFLYWIMFYYFVKFLKTNQGRYIFMYSIAVSMMLWIHYRTIVIVGLSIVFLGILLMTKKLRKQDFLISIIIFVGGYLIFSLLKENHYGYIGGVNEITGSNVNLPYDVIIQNVIVKIGDFIKGCFIQTYYFFIIGSVPFVFWLLSERQMLKSGIKKIDLDIKTIVLIFLVLMYVGNVLANATSQINVVNRYDKVVYARYMENIMGPILLIGFYFMTTFEIKLNIKTILIGGSFIEILAIMIYQKMLTSSDKVFAIDSAVGLGAFFDFYPSEIDLFKGAINSFIVFGVLILISAVVQNKMYIKNICLLSLIALFWIGIGNTANKYHDNMRIHIKDVYYEVVNEIDKLEPNRIIYIRAEEAHPTCLEAKYLQWALVDRYVFDVINSKEVKSEEVDVEAMYVTSSKTDVSGIVEAGFELYASSEKLNIYIYNEEYR